MSDQNIENLGGNGVCGAISGSEVGREGSGGGLASGGSVVWGPAIAVNGKRPGWLEQGQEFQAGGGSFDWFGIASVGKPHIWNRAPNTEPSWNGVDHIRLPADHPHYRQPVQEKSYITGLKGMSFRPMDTQAAFERGMKPWDGGDAAPDDWDGKEVLTRSGEMVDPKDARDAFTWGHASPDDKLRMPHFDIVAYNPKPSPIDWSGELEAVHEDGRVVPVQLKSGPDPDGDYNVTPAPEGGHNCFRPDGSKWVGKYLKPDTGWRIRNVTPQPAPQADTKPDVTARMEALVREIAEHGPHAFITKYMAEEARAIVALLPEPVDPDLIEAREIAAAYLNAPVSDVRDGGYDSSPEVGCALMGLKRRGIALAGETLQEAKTTLDVFLAAYDACADHALVNRAHDDDLLTYGHLRTILRALTGETGK